MHCIASILQLLERYFKNHRKLLQIIINYWVSCVGWCEIWCGMQVWGFTELIYFSGWEHAAVNLLNEHYFMSEHTLKSRITGTVITSSSRKRMTCVFVISYLHPIETGSPKREHWTLRCRTSSKIKIKSNLLQLHFTNMTLSEVQFILHLLPKGANNSRLYAP